MSVNGTQYIVKDIDICIAVESSRERDSRTLPTRKCGAPFTYDLKISVREQQQI